MVGAVRFELTTSCTRSKRASQTTLRPDMRSTICLSTGSNAILKFRPDFKENKLDRGFYEASKMRGGSFEEAFQGGGDGR